MLTPDDGNTDGRIISYLDNPAKWSCYNPPLFRRLRQFVTSDKSRRVASIENTDLLANAKFYSTEVPEGATERNLWLDELIQQSQNTDLVFLDKDNGIEIKSKPYGRNASSKFLYWREVKTLLSSQKSLLIYQHFIREQPRYVHPAFVANFERDHTGFFRLGFFNIECGILSGTAARTPKIPRGNRRLGTREMG